jgi:hypothetical protein
MSEIDIDKKKLIKELMRDTPYVVNAVREQVEEIKLMRLSRHLLEIATPVIQANLKNAANLPTKENLKQFYDTESFKARWTKYRNNPKKSAIIKQQQPHLLDLWEVGYKTGKGGHGSIIISNPKQVTSKNGSYPLFKLLWEGTDTYVVPIPLKPHERARLITNGSKKLHGQYLARLKEDRARLYADWARIKYQKVGDTRMKTPEQIRDEWLSIKQAGFLPSTKKGEMGEFFKTGGGGGAPRQTKSYVSKTKIGVIIPPDWNTYATENQPKKMSFYNRFKGKFYYNVFQRRGIESEVVQDFHDYIAQCVFNGLSFAYGEPDEDAINSAIGQVKFL